jgi:tetratricopeptide (TPR) repeat protein
MACQHDRAIVSLRRALDINPSFSLGYGTLGTVLAWGGAPDESIANNELALRINPSDPLNAHRHFGLSLAHYLASRYEKAWGHAGIVVQLRPDWWLALIVYAATLAQLGRIAEARAACADLRRAKPDMTMASLGALPFAKASDRDHVAEGLRKAGMPRIDASPAAKHLARFIRHNCGLAMLRQWARGVGRVYGEAMRERCGDALGLLPRVERRSAAFTMAPGRKAGR